MMHQMNKLFVLVREDLDISYRFVQGAHAVAEWSLKYPDQWKNETLIFLSVKNEFQLIKWIEKLKIKKMKYVCFNEPDIGNEITAIATLGDNEIFKKLKLA